MPDRAELGRTVPLGDKPLGQPAAEPAAPSVASEPMDERSGVAEHLRRLGLPAGGAQRIEIGGVLGTGATARVYAATDHDLERPIAVKLLTADGAATPED